METRVNPKSLTTQCLPPAPSSLPRMLLDASALLLSTETPLRPRRTHWDTSRYLDQDVLTSTYTPQDQRCDTDTSDWLDEESRDALREGSRDKEGDAFASEKFIVESMATPAGNRTEHVEKLTYDILAAALSHMSYSPVACRLRSQDLAGRIMTLIKGLGVRHYKYVAVVSIGSLGERPGMHFGSRCLWDDDADSFVTVKYSNETLFAVAMIYGLQF